MPAQGRLLGFQNGLGCGMDTGGWFLIDDLLDKANRHIFTRSRGRPMMDLHELATLAPDGTEDIQIAMAILGTHTAVLQTRSDILAAGL